MASRNAEEQAPAPALSPNTISSSETSSSTQSQQSFSSSYEGLSATTMQDTKVIIDKLLYGSSPKKEIIYLNEAGQPVDIPAYQLNYLKKSPDGSLFDPVSGQKYTMQTKITPSSDSVLNADPEKTKTLLTLRNLLDSYSPDAASKDAETAVGYSLQKAMETNAPAIQRAVENAGTSGGSMSALLSQDLAARASGEAATLGMQNKQAYGQISGGLSSTLSQLVTQKDPRLEQLISALGLTRSSSSGASSTSTSSTEGSRSSSPIGLTSELFKQPTSSATADNKSLNTTPEYYPSTPTWKAPASSGSGFISSSSGLTLFGGTTTDQALSRLASLS